MPLFSRQRGRSRRVSPDKVQPPEMVDGVDGPPSARTTGAVFLGTLFAALLVLAVVWGRPPLRFSLGDVVPVDVNARVRFRYADPEVTRSVRSGVRDRTPAVYEFDNSTLVVVQTDLFKVLDGLGAAARLPLKERRERIDALRVELPVKSAAAMDTLVADLARGEASTVRVRLRKLFADLCAVGIMSDERKAAEMKTGVVTVVPRHGGIATERTIDLIDDMTSVGRKIELHLGEKTLPLHKESASVLRERLKARLKPTLEYDEKSTQLARDAVAAGVPEQVVWKDADDLLISARSRVGLREYDMLTAEQSAFLASQSFADRWKRIGGVAVLVVAAIVLGGVYLRHYRVEVLRSNLRLTVLGLLIISMVLVARGLLYIRWMPHPLYLVPVGFASMMLSLAYDRKFSCGVTLFIVLMVGLATEAEFRPLLVLLAGGLVASLYTYNIRKRTKLLKLGLVVGLVHVVVIFGVSLGQLHGVRGLLEKASVGMINGIGVGFVITGLLPFFEPLFRITTDISLLELGDLNQPALKSFALRAPGSYNHSLTVGVLAEAAARTIAADDLLTRVGSYFHDIGKINKPRYFVENQGDQGSRHDRLSARMSALVITAHVKDGLELGRDLGLPRPILDVIAQHHGTTLVEYFYKQAKAEAADDAPPDEYIFRYPGPPPRTREAAIVMLADSVESASRVLSDPTPARVEMLVRMIVTNKLHDGQLEDCNLTLRELHRIEKSLAKGLISVFHGRIKY